MPKDEKKSVPLRKTVAVQKGGSRTITPAKLTEEHKTTGRHQHKAPENPSAKISADKKD